MCESMNVSQIDKKGAPMKWRIKTVWYVTVTLTFQYNDLCVLKIDIEVNIKKGSSKEVLFVQLC